MPSERASGSTGSYRGATRVAVRDECGMTMTSRAVLVVWSTAKTLDIPKNETPSGDVWHSDITTGVRQRDKNMQIKRGKERGRRWGTGGKGGKGGEHHCFHSVPLRGSLTKGLNRGRGGGGEREICDFTRQHWFEKSARRTAKPFHRGGWTPEPNNALAFLIHVCAACIHRCSKKLVVV